MSDGGTEYEDWTAGLSVDGFARSGESIDVVQAVVVAAKNG